MAEVRCTCGQSFCPHGILGKPRTHCPFCRRALSGGEPEAPLLAQVVEPREVRPVAPPLTPPQPIEGTANLRELVRKKAELSHQSQRLSHTASWSLLPDPALLPERPTAPPRPWLGRSQGPEKYVPLIPDPALTAAALADVQQLLAEDVARRPQRACKGCDLATCDLAFQCGALPREGHGLWFTLKWFLIAATPMFCVAAIIFVYVWLFDRTAPPVSAARVLIAFVAAPGILGLVAGGYAWHCSELTRQHLRALAAAAKALQLRLATLRLPAKLAGYAFPVICPSRKPGRRPIDDEELVVQALLSGQVDGVQGLLISYQFLFGRIQHTLLGVAIKLLRAIAGPTLLRWDGSWQPWWKGYVVMVFPQPLTGVPDFALSSAGAIETLFLRRNYYAQQITIPSKRGERRAVLASGTAAWQAPARLKELLTTLEPGWSMQVLAGRLMVWHRSFHYLRPSMLPRTQAAVLELIEVASKIRQILAAGTYAGDFEIPAADQSRKGLPR